MQPANAFSPPAQFTDAADKARRLNIIIISSSFKTGFDSTIGALVRTHLKYGMPAGSPSLFDINHQEQIQRMAARLVTSFRHFPCEEGLQWLGLHSLQ